MLDKLGGKIVKRDDGGAFNVQDLDAKQLLLAIFDELRIHTIILKEISGIDVNKDDLKVQDID